MSDTFSHRVTRDLGVFDFFRNHTFSRSHRESRTTSHLSSRSSVNEPKPRRRFFASSASIATSTPASDRSEALHTASSASSSAAPLPLVTSLSSVDTTASVESINNDHLSDDDSCSDLDDDTLDAVLIEERTSSTVGSAVTKYEVIHELGCGATAVVQLGRLRGGEDLVALKVFKTSLLKKMRDVKRVGRRMVVSTALDKVQMEIAIMKKLHHPNLLNLLEVFDDDSEMLVLMLEYAPLGQVMQWYPEERRYKKTDSKEEVVWFGEEELRVCVRQLLLGLEYLHENNICHRDLKPENILVGQDGTYKIADFGVAHFFDDDDQVSDSLAKDTTTDKAASLIAKPQKKGYVSTTAGTYAFMGPETLKGGEYSAYAADTWALGITIYALAFGTIPFYDPDVMTLFEMIEKNPIDFDKQVETNRMGDGLIELLHGLLEKDPEKRWSLQKCKEHPWVVGGLSDQEKQQYMAMRYEAVTVGPEDLARAVTRVTSLNVISRVKLSANKWKRKAMQTLEKRRQSLPNGTNIESSTSRISSVSSVDSMELELKQASPDLALNQLEI